MRANGKAERLKIKDMAKAYGITPDQVETVIKSQYRFMYDNIVALQLTGITTREEFEKLKTNYNIPCIGKLYASWAIFKKINKIEE